MLLREERSPFLDSSSRVSAHCLAIFTGADKREEREEVSFIVIIAHPIAEAIL